MTNLRILLAPVLSVLLVLLPATQSFATESEEDFDVLLNEPQIALIKGETAPFDGILTTNKVYKYLLGGRLELESLQEKHALLKQQLEVERAAWRRAEEILKEDRDLFKQRAELMEERTFLEKHGVSVGVAIGVVGASAIFLGLGWLMTIVVTP